MNESLAAAVQIRLKDKAQIRSVTILGKLEPVEYKKRTMSIWDEVAPRYHKRWASTGIGPFQSTNRLVSKARIQKGDKVLDMACGTGAVTRKISSRVGPDGGIVGFDISRIALKIAKNYGRIRDNVEFVLADAETGFLKGKFDVITCQYALFFFPDAHKALYNARRVLKPHGTLAVSVHGHNVPYFNCILDAVTKFIPDYVPPGAPNLDRFGSEKTLAGEVKKAGFTKIKTETVVFRYSPGEFKEYWRGYLRYVARPLKERIDRLPAKEKRKLREAVRENTQPYVRREKIHFPWEVVILTASKL